jgi:hypothetical protein
MNYLYLITEDDNDDLFFEGCLENLTGLTFQMDNTRRRLRKGGGIKEAQRMLRLVLQEIRRFGTQENIYLVVAIDNDRAPEHPFHQQLPGLNATEQRMNCRFCELLQIIEDALGKDRSQWPIRGAIAVPVQMLESWLLLSCGHQADSLSLFASKAQPIAARYYAPRQPTDQLKDLCTLERQKAANLSMTEFCLICAHSLNTETLAEQSPSFANFKTQVDSWM